MIAVRQCLARYRHAAMVLLAFAFAMRALIPQGMMAAPDAARGVAVLLCDGTGVAGRIDLPMGEKPGKPVPAQACPFGVLAHAASPDAPDTWAIGPLRHQTAIPALVRYAFLPSAAKGERPPARAPPVAA